jgi:hypothetical protein
MSAENCSSTYINRQSMRERKKKRERERVQLLKMATTIEKKKRSINWTEKDKCTLVTFYRVKHNTIVGKFKPTAGMSTTQLKQEAWKSIESQFTASNPDTRRSLEEIKVKIENLKVSERASFYKKDK